MSARMNSQERQERSTRGASLPLVLLLFLVCAMASSIVLAAASAAAGRTAGLAESDQLYYSASSAARLFSDEIAGDDGSGRTVTVLLSQELSADGSTAVGAPTLALLRDGTTRVDPEAGCTLLERATFFALFGRDFETAQAAQQWVASSGVSWDDWLDTYESAFPGQAFATFTLQHDNSLDAKARAALDLQVRAEVDAEGNLLFRFLEPDADASKDDGVLLTLTCSGDYDAQRIDARADASNNAPSNAAMYDVQTIIVTWKPSGIEGGVGSHAA
ncbi:MAG: hypothetical protein IJ111_01945 [Eggerthellaceae bacterium]|nr:hypothetical protein [Eggerthellaceae bacterium]